MRVFSAKLAYLTILAILSSMEMPVLAQSNRFRNGDIFVSIDSGRVLRFSPTGAFLELLQIPGGETDTRVTGSCFNAEGHLYVTYFGNRSMSHFDPQGRLIDGAWGGPFSGSPESCVADGQGHIYTGEVDGTDIVRKFDTAGRLLDSYRVAPGSRGIDWIDLAADQCTLYYTSEGNHVKRYDVCRKKQIPDFAQGLSGPCFALRVRENGELLVTCQGGVYRLNPEGNTKEVYRFTTTELYSMSLDPDGLHFWVASYSSGDVYKVDIDTGTGRLQPVFNCVTALQERGLLEPPPHRVTDDNRSVASVNIGGLAVYGERTAAIAESLRKAEEEARRKAEEEARRMAAEEQARRMAAEKQARRMAAEEQARRTAEEQARRTAEEQARRMAAEEQARRMAAEEQARRMAEEEARRMAEETRRREENFAPIDRIVKELPLGDIAFNSPQEMALEEIVVIDLQLSVLAGIEELRRRVAARSNARKEEIQAHTVQVNNFLRARLSGSGFRITSITEEERFISSASIEEWRWEIQALEVGKRSLHLTLSTLIEASGKEHPYVIETFQREVEVTASFGRKVSLFLAKYWQWLWAAIVAPLALAIRAWWEKRQRAKAEVSRIIQP